MCRSRRELSNEYLLAKIGDDTAENEPLEVWGKIFNINILFNRVLTGNGNACSESRKYSRAADLRCSEAPHYIVRKRAPPLKEFKQAARRAKPLRKDCVQNEIEKTREDQYDMLSVCKYKDNTKYIQHKSINT